MKTQLLHTTGATQSPQFTTCSQFRPARAPPVRLPRSQPPQKAGTRPDDRGAPASPAPPRRDPAEGSRGCRRSVAVRVRSVAHANCIEIAIRCSVEKASGHTALNGLKISPWRRAASTAEPPDRATRCARASQDFASERRTKFHQLNVIKSSRPMSKFIHCALFGTPNPAP